MKKGIAVFMAALVISCSAVCVSCTEREVTGTVSVADDVYEMPDTDALKKNEGVMVTFTRTPGGDMTQEEFEAKTDRYTVYFSGEMALSNSDRKVQLSDKDYKKVAEFADKLCKGKLPEPESANGGDMPSFSADAYDTSGAHYHLNLPNGDSLKEYSEVYTLVRSYFE